MPTPKQAIHNASKAAARDLPRGITGRIIDIKANSITAAIYDALTATSVKDYDFSVDALKESDPVIEAYCSPGLGGNTPLLFQDELFVDGLNTKGRTSSMWAPPSSPRLVTVQPGIEDVYTKNISIGDWVTLIPMGTGDNYTIGTIISHATDRISKQPFMSLDSTTSEGSSLDTSALKG